MSSSTSKICLCLRWLCLLIILCINTSSCEGSRTLCGSKLADTLDMICGKRYGIKTKKSIDPLDYNEDNEDEIPSSLRAFLSPMSHNSNALTKTRRRRHGVASECCSKPCTYSELYSYCL